MEAQNNQPYPPIFALEKMIRDYVSGGSPSYDDIIAVLHVSILNGDFFQHSAKSVQDQINGAYECIDRGLVNTFGNEDKKKELEGLRECLDLYHSLKSFVFREFKNYYSDKIAVDVYHNSKAIDTRPLKLSIENPNYKRPGATDNTIFEVDQQLLRLNILVCEADFILNCTTVYISYVSDIYSMIDYWGGQNDVKVKKYAHLVGILQHKCGILLAKSLRKRDDLGKATDYYSYKERKHVRFDSNKYFGVNETFENCFFNAFISLSNENALKIHFSNGLNLEEVDHEKKLSELQVSFEKKKREIRRDLENGYINFAMIHFVCKYLRLSRQRTESDLEKAISELDRIYQACKKLLSKNRGDFQNAANESLLSFICNTKLRLYEDRINEKCRAIKSKAVDAETINSLFELYQNARPIFNEINGRYQKHKSIKDYMPYKSYLRMSLEVGNVYLEKVDSLLDKSNKNIQLDICSDYLDKLSVLATGCVQTLLKYNSYLKWAENKNHMALYLPYDQCRIEISDRLAPVSYKLFLCSSYLTPINYYIQKQDHSVIGYSIEELLTQFLIATKKHNDISLKIAQKINRKELEKAREYLIRGAEKKIELKIARSEIKIDKEINNNNIRSIQYLGTFSAVFALIITVWQNVQIIDNIEKFKFGLAFISTLLLLMLSLITIITLPLYDYLPFADTNLPSADTDTTPKRKKVLENWYKVFALILLVGVGSYFTHKFSGTYAEFEKERKEEAETAKQEIIKNSEEHDRSVKDSLRNVGIIRNSSSNDIQTKSRK